MRLLFLLTVVTLTLPLTAACAEDLIGTARVALVYSDHGNFRHRDDYDQQMKQFGWRMDKYENTRFAELADKLNTYDILLGSALFNYSNIQDLSEYKDALLRFMERGGAIVWTDTNYAQHVNWLAGLGEGFEVGSETAASTSTPMGWMDARHPIFNVPNKITTTGTNWAHMVPGEKWQVLARSKDEKPTALFLPRGRGFMMLTCMWGYPPVWLQNVWGTLQVHRAGLIPTVPDFSVFGLGGNEAAISVRNVTGEAQEFAAAVEVKAPDGTVSTHAREASVAPGSEAELLLTVPLIQRGEHRITATYKAGGRAFFTHVYNGPDIPPLLGVRIARPAYRNSIYLSAPPEEMALQVRLHPQGESLATLALAAELVQGDALVSHTSVEKLPGSSFDVTLPVGELREGTAELRVSLVDGDKALTDARVTVPVVGRRSPQVFVDPELATRVDGEPYFPIAVYHIGLDELPKARELGFNSFQGWGTSEQGARDNLDAAQKLGMTVILEMSSWLRAETFDEAGLGKVVEALKEHPALLAWYTVDEPDGEEPLRRCKQALQLIVENDPHHPVYLVMCSPGSFRRFADTTDILAIDPYPIPGSVVMVSDWMRTAQEAVEGRQPIWIIPQLHNWSAYSQPGTGRGPTPEEERNMVYQGLIWGAKGVVYYPWDDGVTGLKYEPALMEAVGKINRELAIVGPELLRRRHTLTARNEGAHEGLFAAAFTSAEGSYVIAASVTNEAREFAVPTPGLADGELEVMFEERTAHLAGGAIQDRFGPLEVHVYRTR